MFETIAIILGLFLVTSGAEKKNWKYLGFFLLIIGLVGIVGSGIHPGNIEFDEPWDRP